MKTRKRCLKWLVSVYCQNEADIIYRVLKMYTYNVGCEQHSNRVLRLCFASSFALQLQLYSYTCYTYSYTIRTVPYPLPTSTYTQKAARPTLLLCKARFSFILRNHLKGLVLSLLLRLGFSIFMGCYQWKMSVCPFSLIHVLGSSHSSSSSCQQRYTQLYIGQLCRSLFRFFGRVLLYASANYTSIFRFLARRGAGFAALSHLHRCPTGKAIFYSERR